MLRLFKTAIKFGLFATLILVLGQWIRWDGRTLSDQVRVGMAHAERAPVIQSARERLERLWKDMMGALRPASRIEDVSQRAREAKARTERRVNDLLDSERAELEEILRKPGEK